MTQDNVSEYDAERMAIIVQPVAAAAFLVAAADALDISLADGIVECSRMELYQTASIIKDAMQKLTMTMLCLVNLS